MEKKPNDTLDTRVLNAAPNTKETVAAEDSADARVPDDAYADDNADEYQEKLPESLQDEEDDEERSFLFGDACKPVADTPVEENVSDDISPCISAYEDEDIRDESQNNVSVKSAQKKKDTAIRKVEGTYDILEMFVFALAFVLLAMAFLFRHSVVDGDSMDTTLTDKEHVIISDIFYTPNTGDIVVVQDYSKAAYGLDKPIIKRVIATEGQTVMIERDGRVYVDGEQLLENYVYIDAPFEYEPLALTVPENCVFLMGDHRNISLDSRSVGVFREDAIVGKVILRFLPLSRFGKVE